MLSTSRVKHIASALLLISLALPAYTCVGYEAPDGTTVTWIPPGADSADYAPTRITHYFIEVWSPEKWEFWVTVLAFTWPLGLLLLRRQRSLRGALWWVEPACALLAGWFIVVSASWGRLAAGAYMALGANSSLLLAWVAEARQRWVARDARAELRPSPSP